MTIRDGSDTFEFVVDWLGRCLEIVSIGGNVRGGGSDVTGFETGWFESRSVLVLVD